MRGRLLAVACLLQQAFAVRRAWSERGAWGDAAPGGARKPRPFRASRRERDVGPRDDTTAGVRSGADATEDIQSSADATKAIQSSADATAGIQSSADATEDIQSSVPTHGRLATPADPGDGDAGLPPVNLAAQADQGTTVLDVGMAGFFTLQGFMEVGSVIRICCDSVQSLSEDVRIQAYRFSDFSIVLEEALTRTFPIGSAVTVPVTPEPTPSPTMVVLDDPHVTNLQGERFDIRTPSSECVLLRVPVSNKDPELLRLSVSVNTDGMSACGLYVKAVALSGSLLDNQVVRVRPHTRNVAGSNQAGNKTMTNFSMQVGSSSWKDFSQAEDSIDIPGASVGVLRARFVRREEFGERVEAQSVQLLVGRGERPAVFTILQAKHQALNLEIQRFGELGHRRVGGVLGTEGRDAKLEQPTLSCRRMRAPHNQERHAVWDTDVLAPARALAPLSSISASWQ